MELESFDFKILSAENGLKGLELYKKNKNQIDCIVTDHKMPKMTGLEMFKEIQNENPKIGCIFLSAFTEKNILNDSPAPKNTLFISKPCDVELIVEAAKQFSKNYRGEKAS